MNTGNGGVEGLQAEVLLVLGRVGADLFERLEHVLGSGRRRGQMGTFRAEAVLVGDVHDAVQHAVGASVGEGSVGAVGAEAFLVGGDTVARLVLPVVVTVVLQHVLVPHDLGVSLRVLLLLVLRAVERTSGDGGHDEGDGGKHETEHGC
uniref:Uncharacterized protein n=1 Tax=Anopheles atroparvus TaxID=41427 RepID=A0A182J5S5_ANOAO